MAGFAPPVDPRRFIVEAFVTYLRDPKLSTLFWLLSFFLFLLASPGTAQEKSKTGRATQQKPAQKERGQATESQIDPVDQHYRSAETFQLAGDLNSAEAEYRQVISLALQRMAAVRVLEQDTRQVMAFLRSALQTDPSDSSAQMALASVYFDSGDLANAKAILQAVLARDEHLPGAKNLLGKIYFMEGDYAGAADQLKGAWAEAPDIDVAYSLALAYLKLNQVSNAANLFDEMLASLGSSADVHVLIGRAYLDGGQYDLAISEFRKALSLNPAVTRAHVYLGRAYLLQPGDTHLTEAGKEFEAEIARNPKDYSSHFYLGITRFQQHEAGPAEFEFKKAISVEPNSPDAYFYLGRAQSEAGENDASLVQLEKAIQLYGASAKASQPAHELYAAILKKVGKDEQADHELEVAHSLASSSNHRDLIAPQGDPPNSEVRAMFVSPRLKPGRSKISSEQLSSLKEALGNAYHNLGVILARRGEYANAASFFAQAAEWTPKIKALDKNWGTASFRAQQYQNAIAPLERHTAADPQDMNARQMLALSYFMTEDFPKAAKTFRPLLASLPDNPSLLYAAGMSLGKSGDSREASEVFNRMLQKNPDAAEVHLFLAQAYADLKQDQEALDEFARALELNPKLPEVNYGAGLVHLRQGDRDSAEKEFRAELAVNPGNASAEYRLGSILLGEQKQAEAIGMLTDVVRQEPNDADAHYTLGKALLESGDLKPAIARLETAVHLDPSQPNPYYQLSLAYRRDGRAQEAEDSLRQYQQLKEKKIPHRSENDSGKSQ